MKSVIDALEERGFIQDKTDPGLREYLKHPRKVYAGFDPSSDSLHLGNLIPIIGLAWFQKFGHTPVALVGGATGMIGDPSGRSKERVLLDRESIESNAAGIAKDLRLVLDFDSSKNAAFLVNNFDWFQQMSVIEFLRDVGKHFRLGAMLGKESVRARMESEEGISYTEFSYQLLQGFDFLHLYKKYGVTIELGGSDQWGNITAGTELVRKTLGQTVFGITFPLLMRSDGKKFGKTEEGAIWLSADKLSPYHFYQYLIRVPDADVVQMMRLLTFMEMDEIRHWEKRLVDKTLEPNAGQRRLAEEVTRLIHGPEGVETALRVTQAAKPGAETILDAATLQAVADQMPHCRLPLSQVEGASIIDLLVLAELCSSKSEGRRAIKGGGVYLNNERVVQEDRILAVADIVEMRFVLLAVGKKNKVLIQITG